MSNRNSRCFLIFGRLYAAQERLQAVRESHRAPLEQICCCAIHTAGLAPPIVDIVHVNLFNDPEITKLKADKPVSLAKK